VGPRHSASSRSQPLEAGQLAPSRRDRGVRQAIPRPAPPSFATKRACAYVAGGVGQAACQPGDRPSVLPTRSDKVPLVSTQQRYRLRNPASGREVVIEALPDEIYLDRESGEPLEIVGKLLPLAPSPSRLPWAVENLRFCPWCDQLAQKDLNDCPTCGRRMGPLGT
jgi:hypothetical protein